MNWPKQKWLLAPLLPLSWLYRSLVACRNFFYDKKIFATVRVPAKVVSIGNLNVGGSGKTPTAAFLANALLARGYRVALVARGYGRTQRNDCIVSDGHTVLATIHEAGDEPLLLAQQCPGAIIVVAENKTRAAQIAAERFQPHFILVDDGFQHRRLWRDLDVLLLPAPMPLQKPWLLPAGPLREPLHNLRRAHVVLLTELSRLNVQEQQIARTALQQYTSARVLDVAFTPGEIHALFAGKTLASTLTHAQNALLVSGIARPERLRKSAETAGIHVVEHIVYRDHHKYTTQDVERIIKKFYDARAESILTTAKDAVKLRGFAQLQPLPIYILESCFTAETAALTELLETVLARDAEA